MAFLPLETDLYPPLEEFFHNNGYTVHAEVLLSDISAVKENELLVVEIKTRFNLEVVLQAVRRQEAADTVYVAVPLQGKRKYPRKWRDIRSLFRRLGIGVLFVRFLPASAPVVEIALRPGEGKPRRKPSIRGAMLREIRERRENFNVGGSVGRPLVTAYRMEALKTAAILAERGTLSPKTLREFGAGEKCAAILQKNYYAWFERVDKGLYRISEEGAKALVAYRDVLATLLKRD